MHLVPGPGSNDMARCMLQGVHHKHTSGRLYQSSCLVAPVATHSVTCAKLSHWICCIHGVSQRPQIWLLPVRKCHVVDANTLQPGA